MFLVFLRGRKMTPLKDDIRDLVESIDQKEFHELCNLCRTCFCGWNGKSKEQLTEQDMYEDRKFYESFVRWWVEERKKSDHLGAGAIQRIEEHERRNTEPAE